MAPFWGQLVHSAAGAMVGAAATGVRREFLDAVRVLRITCYLLLTACYLLLATDYSLTTYH